MLNNLILKKRYLKFICPCVNSNNTIVTSVSSSTSVHSLSTFGENYMLLAGKFANLYEEWKSCSVIHRKIYDVVHQQLNNFAWTNIVRFYLFFINNELQVNEMTIISVL